MSLQTATVKKVALVLLPFAIAASVITKHQLNLINQQKKELKRHIETGLSQIVGDATNCVRGKDVAIE